MILRVYGLPAPQGSKKHVGHGVMIESSKKVKPWRIAVQYAAIELGRPKIAGAVKIDIAFTMPKPKSAPKTRHSWADRKPDIDKLVRSTFDALTEVGCIEDDARCVELRARKLFPGDGCDAMDVPGAIIRIEAA